MEAKLKAEELVEKFECYVDYQGDDCFTEREKMLINAKQCALIAVDELIDCTVSVNIYPPNFQKITPKVREYWQEVKQEIENYDVYK